MYRENIRPGTRIALVAVVVALIIGFLLHWQKSHRADAMLAGAPPAAGNPVVPPAVAPPAADVKTVVADAVLPAAPAVTPPKQPVKPAPAPKPSPAQPAPTPTPTPVVVEPPLAPVQPAEPPLPTGPASGMWSGSFTYLGSSLGSKSYSTGSFEMHARLVQDGERVSGKASVIGVSCSRGMFDTRPSATQPVEGRLVGKEFTWTAVERGNRYGGRDAPYTRTENFTGTLENGVITGQFETIWEITGEPRVRYWGDAQLKADGQ
ncbi:MAG: hypothetical protein HGA47_04055 [Zoogloea sp.]|nr:hypothetical protein [Zoogloea sp.]